MKAKDMLFIAAAGLALSACGGANQGTAEQTSGLTLSYIDTTHNPGDDFYEFANAGWRDAHPLPGEYGRYATFDMLSQNIQKNLLTLIEEAAKQENAEGSNAQKVCDLYTLVMDSTRLNAEGAAPIKADLDEIAAMKTTADVYAELAQLAKIGVTAYYSIGVGADAKNSKENAVSIRQAGLSLGQKNYYFDQDDATKNIREAFRKHVANMFRLAGYDDATAQQAQSIVMDVETRLANEFRSRVEMRNPEANYNKMTIDELKKNYSNIPFDDIFRAYGLDGVKEVIVGQPNSLTAAARIINSLPIEQQRIYLQWKLIASAASSLSDAFSAESFDFNDHVMGGATQQAARWKRALNAVNGAVGMVLGQMYVEKYFPAAAKERMIQLVKDEQEALGERIKALTWMSDSTKAQALDKLASFRVKIGYPDTWQDYSALTIDKSKTYWDNTKAARLWRFNDGISKFGKPVDPTEWHMTPQTVNAYYSSTTNEICFPAGILQPPFFDMNADDAFNYGGIGVVIGHEMSHGFDDSGSKFDAEGNMRNWWTDQDRKNFEERAQVLVDYFSNIEVAPGVHGNGSLTLGENIGDHGGLKIAWTAYKKATANNPLPEKDGYTADQRFFLAYAGLWACQITDQEILRRTNTDSHSLGRYRVNGALPQIDAWYEAWGITEKDSLYIPKEKRANVW